MILVLAEIFRVVGLASVKINNWRSDGSPRAYFGSFSMGDIGGASRDRAQHLNRKQLKRFKLF